MLDLGAFSGIEPADGVDQSQGSRPHQVIQIYAGMRGQKPADGTRHAVDKRQ
jgi:hypothetical protein